MTINEDIYTSIYICTCIHIINTDLSTCRPSTIVNNKDPVWVRVRLGLELGLVCG